MEDIFLGKNNSKVSTKVPAKAKDAIIQICASLEISESQYFRRALKNQLQSDKQALNPKPANP